MDINGVNVLPMSHVRGGESWGYVGLGILTYMYENRYTHVT